MGAASRYLDWLGEARSDLETARDLAATRHFNAACFYSQQASENAVKALLLFKGAFSRSHGVTELVESATVPRGVWSS